MSPDPNYCYLAIAVFSDMQALERLYIALLDVGLDRHQLCLLGLKSTMNRLLSGKNLPDGGNSLGSTSEKLIEAPSFDGQTTVVATSAPVLRALLNAERATNQLTRPLRGAQRPQIEVRSQLQDGRVALIVQSMDAAQHRVTVREMLEGSGSNITTHQGKFAGD